MHQECLRRCQRTLGARVEGKRVGPGGPMLGTRRLLMLMLPAPALLQITLVEANELLGSFDARLRE